MVVFGWKVIGYCSVKFVLVVIGVVDIFEKGKLLWVYWLLRV